MGRQHYGGDLAGRQPAMRREGLIEFEHTATVTRRNFTHLPIGDADEPVELKEVAAIGVDVQCRDRWRLRLGARHEARRAAQVRVNDVGSEGSDMALERALRSPPARQRGELHAR